ncbi:MAG: RpiB/LacA/LacB family sugar-phosphate isomerase [bacterium]|nr:RpiB/LacA/LacB family sugar-phosphate isomerase [bacterium]
MIFIASDHAGFALKEELKKYLDELSEHYMDLGAKELQADDDYPDYVSVLAKKVVEDNGRGILLCGSAVGVCIVANKFRGIRAGIGYSIYAAKTQREDDDTNVLCLPGRFLGTNDAKEMLRVWLTTPFSGGERHKRRIAKIAAIEQVNMKQ